jgi:hypothetical protein
LFPESKRGNQALNFTRAENSWDLLSFCTLAYQSDRIPSANFMSYSMIKYHAHKLADVPIAPFANALAVNPVTNRIYVGGNRKIPPARLSR